MTLICPYCSTPTSKQIGDCPWDKTAHHVGCWRENGGCSTFACQANPQPPRPNFRYFELVNVRFAAPAGIGDDLAAAQQEARRHALASLRAALIAGQDPAVVQLARTPTLIQYLQGSERLEVERTVARVTALAELGNAIQQQDDAATVESWWRARLLGAQPPPELQRAARAARRRRAGSVVPGLAEAPSIELRSPPGAAPPRSPAEDERDARPVAQVAAVEQIRAAVESDDRAAIVRAATVVRRLGAASADLPWDVIEDAEREAAACQHLSASLENGALPDAALAWARVSSLWPSSLSPELDEAGRATFRAWGYMLRAMKKGNG
jgi:hypothetical protein